MAKIFRIMILHDISCKGINILVTPAAGFDGNWWDVAGRSAPVFSEVSASREFSRHSWPETVRPRITVLPGLCVDYLRRIVVPRSLYKHKPAPVAVVARGHSYDDRNSQT